MKETRSGQASFGANALFWLICVALALIIVFLTVAILRELSESQAMPKTSAVMPAEIGKPPVIVEEKENPSTKPSEVEASDAASPRDAWLNALSSLEFTPFEQAAPQIQKALQCQDREVRLRALNLLVASKDNAEVLPLLAIAQRDGDAEVRRNALAVLENSGLTIDLTPYLLNGAVDGNEEVRGALVETAWSLAANQRDEFLGQALQSSWPDVSSAAFEMLKHESSRKTVALLLNVYASNNVTQIEKANEVMNSLVNETFANAAEASAWWQEHQGSYQDDLSQVVVDSSSSTP